MNVWSGFRLERDIGKLISAGGWIFDLADCGLSADASLAIFPFPTEVPERSLAYWQTAASCGEGNCWDW